jgi:hypothetical protein
MTHGRALAALPPLPRRQLLAAACLTPPVLVALGAAVPWPAQAAAALPVALRELDAAAMDLFDAAEAGQWPRARAALERARRAAADTAPLKAAYTDAGGELHRFFQARNALAGDLPEAGTAIAARDRRWLVGVAERIVGRAGELAQPFVGRADDLQARIEVLIYLARRMRSALVWGDDIGLRSAQADFRELWRLTAAELPPAQHDRRRALDLALERIALTKSPRAVRELYDAVAALGRP